MQLKANRYTTSRSLLPCVRVQESYTARKGPARNSLPRAHADSDVAWLAWHLPRQIRCHASQVSSIGQTFLSYESWTIDRESRQQMVYGVCLWWLIGVLTDEITLLTFPLKIGTVKKIVETLAVVVIWPSLKQKGRQTRKNSAYVVGSCSTADPSCRNPHWVTRKGLQFTCKHSYADGGSKLAVWKRTLHISL